MSPGKISQEIARINQDIPHLMNLISAERRPEHRQRMGNTIKLKVDELIRLCEMRETAQHKPDADEDA